MTEKLQEIKPAKKTIHPVHANFKNDVMKAFPNYEDELFTESYLTSHEYSKRSDIEDKRRHIKTQTLISLTNLEETIATKCRLLDLIDIKQAEAFSNLILAQIEICQYLYNYYYYKYSKM